MLYKKAYCLCIPDPMMVKSLLDEIDKKWIRVFLMQKNSLEFSVVSMFVNIFVKNKQLTIKECKKLLDLIALLIGQLEIIDCDKIPFEKKHDNPIIFYCLFNELMLAKKRSPSRISAEIVPVRVQSLVNCLHMILGKMSMQTINLLVSELKSSFTSTQEEKDYLDKMVLPYIETTQAVSANRLSSPLSHYMGLFKQQFCFPNSAEAFGPDEKTPLLSSTRSQQ